MIEWGELSNFALRNQAIGIRCWMMAVTTPPILLRY